MKHLRNITVSFLFLAFLLSVGCNLPVREPGEKKPCPSDLASNETLYARQGGEMSRYFSSLEEKRKSLAIYRCLMKSRDIYALHTARVSFLLATEAEEIIARITYAQFGSKTALAYYKKSKTPEAAYYYAANKGLVLQSKGLEAIRLLPDVIKHLEISLKKPSIDMGGPYRALAMIHLVAPGKFRNIEKALNLMKKAQKEFPNHPLNHYVYGKALLEDGMDEESEAVLKKGLSLLDVSVWGKFYVNLWKKDIKKLISQIEE